MNNGCVQVNWSTRITVPIFKRETQMTVRITNLPRLIPRKICEKILDQRICCIVQLTINQCGFVKGCGTTHAIFAAHQLIEKHQEKNQPLYMAFLELEKPFDRNQHQLIWYVLHGHGVLELLIHWVTVTLGTECTV